MFYKTRCENGCEFGAGKFRSKWLIVSAARMAGEGDYDEKS